MNTRGLASVYVAAVLVASCTHGPERQPDAFSQWPARIELVVCEPGDIELPSRAGESGDVTLDGELSRLVFVLGKLREACASEGRPPSSVMAPGAARQAWDSALQEIEKQLSFMDDGDSLPCLRELRVSLVTQVELDRAVWRLPAGLTERLRLLLADLERRLDSAMERGGDPEPAKLIFAWPVHPVWVTSSFGWRQDPIDGRRRFHQGVDLVAAHGQLVAASGEGVVTWAGRRAGHGKHIEILHPGGWRTRYSHLSMLLVRRWDRLSLGDPVGLAGSTGRATGPHLHFEIWLKGTVLNPKDVLGEPP